MNIRPKRSGNNRFRRYTEHQRLVRNHQAELWSGLSEWRHLPFLPTPDTWIKMLDILLFWASKGIDGFRCDMAEMVPVEFWAMGYSTSKGSTSGNPFPLPRSIIPTNTAIISSVGNLTIYMIRSVYTIHSAM